MFFAPLLFRLIILVKEFVSHFVRKNTTLSDDNEIFVRVSGDKKDEIRTQLIEGQKCIVIPVSEEDNINIVKR